MAIELLNKKEFAIFTTRDFALASENSLSATSKQLQRYESKKLITKVTRGLWANPEHPYFNPLGLVPYLLGSEQGYVSFLTALHYQEMISQIPRTIQVASTGHTRQVQTVFGRFEFFQMKPELMTTGIIWSKSHCAFRIATKEKALLDTLYISTRKARRFARLPEIDFMGSKFSKTKFRGLVENSIDSLQIKNAILNRTKKFGF